MQIKARLGQKLYLDRHSGNYVSFASKTFQQKLASNCVFRNSFANFGQKKFPKTSFKTVTKTKLFKDKKSSS